MGDRLPVAHMGTFDTQSLGLAVDAFSRGALVVDHVVERPITIQGHAHLPTQFPIDIFDTAFLFGKLGVVTRCSRAFGKEQRAAEALSAITIGVIELKGRLHAQAFGTARGAIGIAFKDRMSVLVQGDSADTLMESDTVIHVPGIEGGISGDVGGIQLSGQHGVAVEGTKVGHIAFIERLGELRKHHIAIDRVGVGSHPSAIAKEADLFHFLGAVGLLLVATLFDAQATIGVAFGNVGDIKAAFDVDIGIVLAHPGENVLDIKGYRFAQAGDVRFQGVHRLHEQALQERFIQVLQLGAQPAIAGNGARHIKAVRRVGGLLRWKGGGESPVPAPTRGGAAERGATACGVACLRTSRRETL